ncbi:MAG TPA: hypothetical protein VG223_07740 [Solirubrobacteraceae bacterium]|nr:hypothetical protein [Solirubrobacteraceae bacterium]
MSAVQTDAPRPLAPPPDGGRPWWRQGDAITVALVVLVAAVLALAIHAHHLQGVPGILRASAASVVLFVVCGDALAYALIPAPWRAVRPVFALALGAAAGALVLTAFGVAHVPLHVSLWLTLAIGLGASVIVRRRGFHDAGLDAAPVAWPRERAVWVAVLFVLWLVALIPAARTGADTIYGENPDAEQVAGIAVLFQHVPPTGTDNVLPVDTVPQEWRFRYPIFYPLAAASNLGHDDPIRVFPAIVALLMVIAAFGFAMLAVECLGAPPRAGPAVAAVIGLSWTTLHLGWHPYWNQLWGYAMFPYALLFGWRAVSRWDVRSVVLFLFTLVMLWLAYPLALPYPVVIVAAVGIGYRRRPPLGELRRARAWIAVPVVLLLLLPAVVGAVLKLKEALSQLLSSSSTLWGGDIHHFLSFGLFVGTGGGIIPALIVLAIAAWGLRALDPRPRLALGIVLGALCLLDLRFRLASSGAYMDFKHLSFVGAVVLTLAASAVMRLLWSDARRLALAGAALLAVWAAAAIVQDRRDGFLLPQQVPAQMFQIRAWMNALPTGATIRVDIPPSGQQVWATYMVGAHPVSSSDPIRGTTYAYANGSYRADYALALRYNPKYGPTSRVPLAPEYFASGPPVFENSHYVLRRVVWPKTGPFASDTDNSSDILHEP